MASLADLQAERERLRAAQAKSDFDKLLADTCALDDVRADAVAARAVLLQTLDALVGRWLSAIEGEHDETRVHYLMSDVAHDVLRELGESVQAATTRLPMLGERIARGAKPRDLLTVSQHADRYRVIRTGTNAPGPWRTALTPYLRDIMDDLSEHSPVRKVVFIKSSGVGGPLALDTPIPTPAGWTTMGAIQAGDKVFDENGAICNVTYASRVFDGRACYQIEFSDGSTVICDDQHRWTVDDDFPGHAGKRRGEIRSSVTKTTAEIAATWQRNGRSRYAIPTTGPLQLPEQDLPIPPYVLGYWLANGNQRANQMTAHTDDASEIAAHLTAAGWPADARNDAPTKGRATNIKLRATAWPDDRCRRGHRYAQTGSFINKAGARVCSECHRQHAMHNKYGKPMDPVCKPDGFLTRIATLGLDTAKRIPAAYLRASADQRIALLQGLLDGDGSIGTNGRIEYSTVSDDLARDAMELICSLGFKPSRTAGRRKAFGTQGQAREGAQHRITFVAYADTPVFRLARKKTRQIDRPAGNPSITGRRRIVDVRPVESRPVRCIAVDSASHLYLCGPTMIPTHNTEAMYNWLGYVMHHLQNKDLLVVVPTLELRDRSFNPRLAKMIDESEALANLVTTASRNKANRGDLLEYGARARIIKAGANSPDSLRSDHLPYVICDEVDAFPWDVGGEGDPMTLIENRQRTFSRAKTYLVSTPTLEGQSRIDIEYRRTDMRRYYVPCPHCDEFQHLEFGGKAGHHGLKWRTAPPPEDDPHHLPQVVDAWYVCKHCGAEISEGHKADMLARGRWVAQRPGVKLAHGYHLNALYAPTGLGLDWRAIAQKWINSQGDTAELKGFVNTYLGEVWREQGDSIEDISLISRLEDYTRDTLTEDGRPLYEITTAGVDVQKDRLEVSIVDWADDEEGWLFDHIILPGDTAQPDVWAELADVLAEAGVQFACIDSGYNTSMVYEFVKPRAWCRAIKGLPGTGRPLVEDEKIRRQRLRRQRKRGVQVEPLGVDQGKALLYARLKMQQPGPGYIHFPRQAAFDDEYFAQLAAEKLVTRFRGTRPVQEWVQVRPRNEALDCLNYALAARRLAGKRPSPPTPVHTPAPPLPAAPAQSLPSPPALDDHLFSPIALTR